MHVHVRLQRWTCTSTHTHYCAGSRARVHDAAEAGTRRQGARAPRCACSSSSCLCGVSRSPIPPHTRAQISTHVSPRDSVCVCVCDRAHRGKVWGESEKDSRAALDAAATQERRHRPWTLWLCASVGRRRCNRAEGRSLGGGSGITCGHTRTHPSASPPPKPSSPYRGGSHRLHHTQCIEETRGRTRKTRTRVRRTSRAVRAERR